jgi:hypothetical protein
MPFMMQRVCACAKRHSHQRALKLDWRNTSHTNTNGAHTGAVFLWAE